MHEPNCVAVFSGGLDSTVLVYKLLAEGNIPALISFDYGQRHSKELQFAEATASRLGLEHQIVNLTGLRGLLSGSSLTSPEMTVPDGHYAQETMKATVVPNRNMIMLSIAAGFAVSRKADFIAAGVHAGDHFVYPDCRPSFISAAASAIETGNEGFADWRSQGGYGPLYVPFISRSKADIASLGFELGVPFHLTWSCYKGGEMHCGKCGTCVERLEAINEARTRLETDWADAPKDETPYEDSTYWREAIAKAEFDDDPIAH